MELRYWFRSVFAVTEYKHVGFVCVEKRTMEWIGMIEDEMNKNEEEKKRNSRMDQSK